MGLRSLDGRLRAADPRRRRSSTGRCSSRTRSRSRGLRALLDARGDLRRRLVRRRRPRRAQARRGARRGRRRLRSSPTAAGSTSPPTSGRPRRGRRESMERPSGGDPGRGARRARRARRGGGAERGLRPARRSRDGVAERYVRGRNAAASPVPLRARGPIPRRGSSRTRATSSPSSTRTSPRRRALAHGRREHRPLAGQAVPDPLAPHRRARRAGRSRTAPSTACALLGGIGGMSLVAGVRWSFRGKDAGSARSRRLRARLRTPPRGEQRGPAAQPSFRQTLLCSGTFPARRRSERHEDLTLFAAVLAAAALAGCGGNDSSTTRREGAPASRRRPASRPGPASPSRTRSPPTRTSRCS